MRGNNTFKHSNPVSEAEFNAAIRDGDAASFSRYYETTMPWLVPHIRRITNDVEEARNIAHDTFSKLWLGREQIDPAKSLDGFVAKIATNAALNLLKKTHSHYKYHSEQMFVQSAEDYPADARIMEAEINVRIAEAIDKMPPQRRKVFELSREQNLTYNEISERLGLSYNTVMNYMKLALADIRTALSLLLLYLCLN